MTDILTEATDPMDLGGRPPDTIRPRAGTLVLLYAAEYAQMPSAFQGDAIVLGREPPPGGVVVHDGAASRVHARVTRKGDGWVVADLDSRNGTLLNGRFVRDAEQPIEHGDEIRVGNAVFKFVEEPADDYALFRIDGPIRRDTPYAIDDDLVGGARMMRLRREIARIGKAALSVLVLGETGSGKEVVARALHHASGRPGKFCGVNCAAIPAQLLESELFGYKRGAFTGADRDNPGHVRAARGGTLLLDEIGDMPLDAQAKILRLLETREVVPLGASTPETVDVRLVCATHRDLTALVTRGAFRADLYARINAHTMRVPPLRDRKEDLFVLVRHFLARHGRTDLTPTLPFMIGALHYDWPYNVRELASAVARAVALVDGTTLDDRHLPEEARECMKEYGAQGSSPGAATSASAVGALGPRESPSEEVLRALLTEHQGSVAAVARALGRDRVQIRRWLKKLAIEAEDYR